ncbi:MAG: ribosome maturation factor RimM [Oscillospiraceae bacterium]|nr:ribosome maturation factor RimM [Oscillospiraceae bacterium]
MKSGFLEAGIIVNTHGNRGEVRVQPWADSPGFLTEFEHFYIDEKPVQVLSSRVQKGCVIATLQGVDDIDAAIRMKNKIIKIKKEDVKLEEGRYFITDLIGLKVVNNETGEALGTLSDILSLPSNNVYVIKGAREILVPAVPEFIVETSLEEGFIKIRLIEGL